MAQGRRPSAILKTKSTVFLKTDRHNVFIFFSMVWRCFLLINTDVIFNHGHQNHSCVASGGWQKSDERVKSFAYGPISKSLEIFNFYFIEKSSMRMKRASQT